MHNIDIDIDVVEMSLDVIKFAIGRISIAPHRSDSLNRLRS